VAGLLLLGWLPMNETTVGVGLVLVSVALIV
jgi:hypothetical protein